MIVHASRRIPKATWLNDRDQFMKPNQEPDEEFIVDCTVWNIFSNSNNTVSMRNVEYEGNIYQIRNHFFPFLISEIKKWNINDSDIAKTFTNANDTFMANWLSSKTLSPESEALLAKGKEIYKLYFENLHQLRTNKFKIEYWDAGWWQIKQSFIDVDFGLKELKELKELHDQLKDKLLVRIKEYGIIE
jgi:hypothetical protein